MAPRLPPNILHHLLRRGLNRRFFQGEIGLHLRSFVTTTKPNLSLNHNLKSVPSALTADSERISIAQCQALGRKPGRAAQQEQIANIVYGGDWGWKNLGNFQAGDGWRYRGGGILQTTGRANYRNAGFEDHPELLRTPAVGLAAALKFWADRDINRLADAGAVEPVRKRINGGRNGLAEAEAYFAKAKRALGI